MTCVHSRPSFVSAVPHRLHPARTEPKPYSSRTKNQRENPDDCSASHQSYFATAVCNCCRGERGTTNLHHHHNRFLSSPLFSCPLLSVTGTATATAPYTGKIVGPYSIPPSPEMLCVYCEIPFTCTCTSTSTMLQYATHMVHPADYNFHPHLHLHCCHFIRTQHSSFHTYTLLP